MGFEKLETAARAREIIKQLSRTEAKAVSPKGLIGRMMSVDLPRLRGTVWFPNDPQPTQVSIFANAIPQDWQHKNSGLPGESSSIAGHGSMVVVERLDDELYVTQVLTGGTAALDFRTLGVNIMQQIGAPTAAGGPTADAVVDIAGDPHETFINCKIQDSTILPGEAIEFGPFTTFEAGTPGSGYMEMTVRMANVQKSYRFVADPANEFDNDYYSSINAIWFRLMPEQELTSGPWAGLTADWDDFDLDISFKKTPYGNTEGFSTFKEMWFRVIRRSSGTGMTLDVTIRATNIQKGRSLGGRELFMQEKVSSPGIFWGILGFHGANHGFTKNFNFTYDVFNRISVGDWGQSNTEVAYVSNIGTATNYSVNGQTGVITISANNTRYHQRQNESRLNFDGTMLLKVGRVATGASIRMGFMTNFDAATSNCWMFSIEFQTSGLARAVYEKRVAGVITGQVALGTIAYTATTRLRIRFQTLNNGTAQSYRIKIWEFGFREPQTWAVLPVETATRNSNSWGVYAQADTGNTNTKNFDVTFEDIQVNSAFGIPQQNGHATNWHTGPWRHGLLRMGQDLQRTWTHTAQFKLQDFSGVSYLRWDGQIWLDGIGSHRNGMHNGRAFIEIPSEGGFFDVRVFPVTGGGGVVTVDPFFGFPLSPGQAIYCGVPPECGFDNLVYNMFYVDGQATQDYVLPEWAVLIAARGPAGCAPDVRLGNGDHIDLWRVPSLNPGWSNFGSGYDGAGYRMEPGGLVRIKGLIKHTTLSQTGTMFILPVGFRPTGGDRIFTQQSTNSGSSGITRVNVTSAGLVDAFAHLSGGGAGFLSLENIVFPTT